MRTVILSLAVLLLSAGAAASAAQAPEPAPAATAQEAPQGGVESAQTGSSAGGALPQRSPPPATLRAYWHLFVAFAVTVVLLFGYALSLGRRFGRLDEEVRRLSRAAE